MFERTGPEVSKPKKKRREEILKKEAEDHFSNPEARWNKPMKSYDAVNRWWGTTGSVGEKGSFGDGESMDDKFRAWVKKKKESKAWEWRERENSQKSQEIIDLEAKFNDWVDL